MARFKDIAIPAKFRHLDGDYEAADGTKYLIPEEFKGKFGRMPFTPEEEAARDAEEAAIEAARPLQEWLGQMSELDRKISRQLEDIIGWVIASTGAKIDGLPENIRIAYLAKKELRANRPK